MAPILSRPTVQAARVESAGGSVFEGPLEIPGGSWIVRCRDPQGAGFALQGKRGQVGIARAPAAEVGWSTAWGGISSRGRIADSAGKVSFAVPCALNNTVVR